MGVVVVLGAIWEIVFSARPSRGRERQRDGFPLGISSGYGAKRREEVVEQRNGEARMNADVRSSGALSTPPVRRAGDASELNRERGQAGMTARWITAW
jgi:hypothetical protein